MQFVRYINDKNKNMIVAKNVILITLQHNYNYCIYVKLIQSTINNNTIMFVV